MIETKRLLLTAGQVRPLITVNYEDIEKFA